MRSYGNYRIATDLKNNDRRKPNRGKVKGNEKQLEIIATKIKHNNEEGD